MKKNYSIFSIILFVLSGLLTAYSIWAFIHCHNYISGAIDSGHLVASGNEFDIANFYMSNSLQYILFAVLIFTAGWMLRKPSTYIKEIKAESSLVIQKNDDENLDEWFEEMRQEK
ncbi:TPA: hypothetical protein QCR75_005764 [Bacillus anthracis]|uniref:hypothetical protein n=1 Tax=Alkaliphilus sp. B6464 TaxID=2731219 RepID=UPI001BA92FD2|nr:hypothetical protein [Alkaliphilus sp. B6464]QUH19465.1 hypothetical protein HYG84_05905 [Alkaliphilus sp. B6464]HDR5039300.1 hypothetical protein [Bacillus anthracis]